MRGTGNREWGRFRADTADIRLSEMTRLDRRGKALKAFFQAEIVGSDLTIEEVRRACGLTRATSLRRAQWLGPRLRRQLSQLRGTATGRRVLQIGRQRVGQYAGRVRLARTAARYPAHAVHRRQGRPRTAGADRFGHASRCCFSLPERFSSGGVVRQRRSPPYAAA